MAERITVYRVVVPHGQAHPELVEIQATRKPSTVKFDQRHQAFGYHSQAPLASVDTDPAAAIARFAADQRHKAAFNREQAAIADHMADLAEALNGSD